MQVKMREFISGKVIRQVSKELEIPMKDATCILVMDDFFDDLKNTAKEAYHGLK